MVKSHLRSVEDVDTIVDVDAHVTETAADIAPYLEDPWKTRLEENKLITGTGVEQTVSEFVGARLPWPGLILPHTIGKVDTPKVNTKEDFQNDHLDMLNIDHAIITPTFMMLINLVHDDDFAVALARAYNNWMLDEFCDEDDRICGAAVVAAQKPDRAAEEIDERATESDIRAVQLFTAGINPPLGHRRWDPIFQAAEDHNLPILLHSIENGDLISTFSSLFPTTSKFLEIWAPFHPAAHMIHLSSMLTHGTPERFPNLQFIMQEAGIGWLPFFEQRYESHWKSAPESAPLLEKKPSEYISEHFYIGSQPAEGFDNPEYFENIVRMTGDDNLLFASDYPHYDFDYTDAFFNALNRSVDDQSTQRIMGGTAKEIFGL